jgi:Trk-type K+ transport system membrane component
MDLASIVAQIINSDPEKATQGAIGFICAVILLPVIEFIKKRNNWNSELNKPQIQTATLVIALFFAIIGFLLTGLRLPQGADYVWIAILTVAIFSINQTLYNLIWKGSDIQMQIKHSGGDEKGVGDE